MYSFADMADSGKNFLNKWNVGFYSTNVYKVGISDRMRFRTKNLSEGKGKNWRMISSHVRLRPICKINGNVVATGIAIVR